MNRENLKYGKMWKKGKKIFFSTFLFLFTSTNTNDAHMQNIIQILRKMNPWIPKIWKQNVFKWEKCTLPFKHFLFQIFLNMINMDNMSFIQILQYFFKSYGNGGSWFTNLMDIIPHLGFLNTLLSSRNILISFIDCL